MKTRQLLLITLTISTMFLYCSSPKVNEKKVEEVKDSISKTPLTFDYAFEREGNIFVCKEGSQSVTLITDGMNPCIAPSGQQIAFTDYSDDGDRQVSVIDLQSKEKKRLAVNNNNFYGAIWSPNGKFIAFNYYIFESASWLIGVIDSENKNFKSITSINKWGASWYAPTWTDDSKKIVTHNLDTIFVYQLNGSVVGIYRVDSITMEHEISSSTRFFLRDNKLFFNGTSGDTLNNEGFQDEEPIIPEAIYSYNLLDSTIHRITPKGIDCSSFYFQGKYDILFSAFNYKTKKPSAYKIKLNGQHLTKLFDNGSEITGIQK